MIDYSTVLSLTSELISVPSYVDDHQDETGLTELIADFLETALPRMVVERQYLEGSSRCNLILKGRGEPKLLVLGHVDTVHPNEGWHTSPLTPVVQRGRLYGLGASDMKGSLAAFLWALVQERDTLSLDNLMLLMYVDEEYNFKGINRFIEDTKTAKIAPDMILSLDGDLEVGSGCRGLIELKLAIRGVSGHSSNPRCGVNAIIESIEALQDLNRELTNFVDTDLGPTTMNIAYLQGGLMQKNPQGEIKWLREGNSIPDAADITLEVRPSRGEVNVGLILGLIECFMEKRGLEVVETVVRHEIAPWPVVFDQKYTALLEKVYAKADLAFKKANRKFQGYIDAHLVAEKFSKPTFIIGTGGANKHAANENVALENLEQAASLYRTLLCEVLS
ncbi:MAG: M20 family metallopeptidase [Pseudonocardiaceae bacterium]